MMFFPLVNLLKEKQNEQLKKLNAKVEDGKEKKGCFDCLKGCLFSLLSFLKKNLNK
jgi:hypothetical protein